MQAAVAAGFPSGNDVHVLKEIKASVKKFDHGSTLRVIEYPASPAELAFFGEAYSNDPPALLDEKKVLDAQVTLRRSNKNSVQAQRDSTMVSKPAADSAAEDRLIQAAKVLGMFMQGRSADVDLDLEILRPTKRRKALGNDVEAAQPANPPAVNAGAAGTQPGVLALEDRAEPAQRSGPTAQPAKSVLTTPAVSSAAEKAPKKEVPEDEEDDDMGPEQLANCTMKKPAAAKPKSLHKKPAMAKHKNDGSATKGKESVSEKMRAGWKRERRYRASGQVDVHYISPSGRSFRTLQEARQNGYRD